MALVQHGARMVLETRPVFFSFPLMINDPFSCLRTANPNSIPGIIRISHLLRLLGGLLGLLTPELLGGGVLLGLLRTADGADASNSILADVTTVAALSGEVGNALVSPGFQVSHPTFSSKLSPLPLGLIQWIQYRFQ